MVLINTCQDGFYGHHPTGEKTKEGSEKSKPLPTSTQQCVTKAEVSPAMTGPQPMLCPPLLQLYKLFYQCETHRG